MTDIRPRSIGALIFDCFETLDLFGPIEMFGTLENHYVTTLVAETSDAVKSHHVQTVMPNATVGDTHRYDMLLISGGRGTPIENSRPLIDARLVDQNSTAELVLTVCADSSLVARNGLLDGFKATTNKMAIDWIAKFGSKVDWVPKARWV